MGDMGDALRKAGLISEEALRRQKHQQRVKRGKVDRDRLEAERAEEARRREAQREARRQRDREVESERREESVGADREARARDMLRAHALREGLRGRRRFHYLEPGGRLPYITVDDEVGRRLESGALGIAHVGKDVLVVPRASLEEAARVDPEVILFLNGR